jgi:hypothetical protein
MVASLRRDPLGTASSFLRIQTGNRFSRAGRCVGQFVVRHALRLRHDHDELNRGEIDEDHHDSLRCGDLGHIARDDHDDDKGR